MAFTQAKKRAYRAERKREGNPVPRGGRTKNRMRDGGFVALDSEGASRPDGSHHSVLWSACWRSDEDPERWEYADIESADGLTSDQIIAFLLDVAQWRPRDTLVVFGASYDFNMLLRFLPFEKAKRLHDEGRALHGQYRFIYRPRRSLSISEARDRDAPFAHRMRSDGSVEPYFDAKRRANLYDVIGFSQTNFLGAIEGFLGSDYPDFELIKAGKEQRADFNTQSLEYIKRYTHAELRALIRIMEKLKGGIEGMGLTIPQWIGAGAVGGAMLRKHSIKQAKPAEPTDEQRDILFRAYFGGRIETFVYGSHLPGDGPIYHYDINSAYPSAMLSLPDMSAGQWVRRKTDNLLGARFTCFRVRWTFPTQEPFYALPYREGQGPQKGSIFFPDVGEGWYWRPEVEAAICAFGAGSVEILEALEWIGDDEARPFAWVSEYYAMRQQIVAQAKRSGVADMREKVIKLGLNSGYGKLAQTLGGSKDKTPAYHNSAWAGWITSTTRAQLFLAARQAPESALSIATDGLWTRAPLDLDVSTTKALGAWEADKLDGLVILQPGFYWFHYADKDWGIFCRGIDKPPKQSAGYQQWVTDTMELTRQCWRDGEEHIPFPTRRFITMGSALISQERFDAWCHWEEGTRNISTVPTGKRRLAPKTRPECAAKRFVRSVPADPMSAILGTLSAPYDPKWSQEQREQSELEAQENEDFN